MSLLIRELSLCQEFESPYQTNEQDEVVIRTSKSLSEVLDIFSEFIDGTTFTSSIKEGQNKLVLNIPSCKTINIFWDEKH